MLGHWHELEPALQGRRDLGQCGGAGYQQLPTWWTFPVEGGEIQRKQRQGYTRTHTAEPQ